MLDAILNLATQPRVLNIASHQSRHGTSCYYDGLRHFSVALKTKKRADHRISTAAIISKKSIQSVDDDDDEMSRVSVQLIPIVSQQQFNQITHDSQDAILILWMATWCRKCIYLKPKLEKLAADYFPRLRFYCVDVNAVPHKLVTLADVSKMPTIQVWKDKKKHGEVIGGHKAYLVVNEIREMIDNTYGGSQ